MLHFTKLCVSFIVIFGCIQFIEMAPKPEGETPDAVEDAGKKIVEMLGQLANQIKEKIESDDMQKAMESLKGMLEQGSQRIGDMASQLAKASIEAKDKATS